MAVGDMFAQAAEAGRNPFAFTEAILQRADLVFGNLEAPFTRRMEPSFEKSVSLRIPPENVSYLKEANFSVVSLANNHVYDHGAEGFRETAEVLDTAGIARIGAGANVDECLREALFERRGRKIAFASFYREGEYESFEDLCIAAMNPQLVRHRIAELKRRSDVVVLSFHWGIENVAYPSPAQQRFARQCVAAGASVIIGHHPHRLQGVERHSGGLIFYSLGNFNFVPCGVGLSPDHDLSTIADITIGDDGSLSYELIPVRVGGDFCPHPITGQAETASFHSLTDRLSRVASAGIEKWWWFGEIGIPYLRGNGAAFRSRIERYGARHLFEMLRWLTGRFAIQCYIGIVRRWLGLDRAPN
jgi:hypothetical protein